MKTSFMFGKRPGNLVETSSVVRNLLNHFYQRLPCVANGIRQPLSGLPIHCAVSCILHVTPVTKDIQ